MHPLEFDELRYLIMERGEEWKDLPEMEYWAAVRSYISENCTTPLTEAQKEDLKRIHQNLTRTELDYYHGAQKMMKRDHAKEALTRAVNTILNKEPDAYKAVETGGRAVFIYDAEDANGEGPAITATLVIENAIPADYFEDENGEIFDEEELEDEAQRIIYELQGREHRKEHRHNCGGCGKCRK